MTDTEKDFSDLTFDERIEVVDKRLGNQPGRIKDPRELLKLTGETIYLVTSPFGKDQDIGTSFTLTWEVGKVEDHRGNPITEDQEPSFDDDEKYICYGHADTKSALSLRDFNIVPNSYNNTAAFAKKQHADAYAMYRKMMFAEDTSIAELEGGYAHFFNNDDIKRLLKAEKENK